MQPGRHVATPSNSGGDARPLAIAPASRTEAHTEAQAEAPGTHQATSAATAAQLQADETSAGERPGKAQKGQPMKASTRPAEGGAARAQPRGAPPGAAPAAQAPPARLILNMIGPATPLEAGVVEHFRRTGQTTARLAPVTRPPRNLEERYTRDLIAMVNHLIAITLATVKRMAPDIEREAAGPAPGGRIGAYLPGPLERRADDMASSIRTAIGQIGMQFKQKYGDPTIASMARAAVIGADEHSRQQAAEVLKTSIGIDMTQAEPWLENELKDQTYINANLIQSIPTEMLDDVQAAVVQAWRSGGNTADLTDRIQEIGKITRNRARLIARDQIGKMNSQLETLRMQSYGLEEYDWICTNDARSRQRHRALHLKRFRVDAPPVTNSNGDRNAPGEDYQCRCSRRWVIPGIKDIAEIQPLTEQESPGRAVPLRLIRKTAPMGPITVRPNTRPAPGAAPAIPRPPTTPAGTTGPGLERKTPPPRPRPAAPASSAQPPHLAPYLPPPDGSPIKVKPPHFRGPLPEDPELAAKILINQWVHGSQRRAATLMKHAIKAELGIDAGIPFSKHVYRFTEEEIQQARPAIRHLYNESQAALKKYGKDEITLHRGISRDYPVKDTAEAWADEHEIAADFARRKNPDTAKVDTQSIPAHRVLTWHKGPLWTNGKYGHQAEWIILTGDPK